MDIEKWNATKKIWEKMSSTEGDVEQFLLYPDYHIAEEQINQVKENILAKKQDYIEDFTKYDEKD